MSATSEKLAEEIRKLERTLLEDTGNIDRERVETQLKAMRALLGDANAALSLSEGKTLLKG